MQLPQALADFLRVLGSALIVAVVLMSCASGQTRRIAIGSSTPGEAKQALVPDRPLITDADTWQRYPIDNVRSPLNFEVRQPQEPSWYPDASNRGQPEHAVGDPTLRLHGGGGAYGAFAEVSFHPKDEGLLTWEWALRYQGESDQPFALMVGFDIPENQASPETLAWARRVEEIHGIRPPLRAIGYLFGGYSSANVAESAFFAPSSVFLINLRPRTDCDGRWQRELRDIARDYRQIFGEEPVRVRALALVGDARSQCSALDGRLRRVAVASGSLQDARSSARGFVERKLHPFWSWLLGACVVLCIFTGSWLLWRFFTHTPEERET